MANATVQVSLFTGATESVKVNAETGAKMNEEDSLLGTTPIAIPASGPATAYSWWKNFAFEVTVVGTTALTNRKVRLQTAPPSGMKLFFQASSSFSQAANVADQASKGPATPAGWTALTTSFQTYDAASAATSSLGRNGQFCRVIVAVDATYAGGAGVADIPDLEFSRDEA